MSETPELEESPRRRFRVTSNHIIIAPFAIEALVLVVLLLVLRNSA